MESHDPEEETKATSSKDTPATSGVEDVGPLQSGPVSSTGKERVGGWKIFNCVSLLEISSHFNHTVVVGLLR